MNILGTLIKQLASQDDDCFEDFEQYEKSQKQDMAETAPTIRSAADAIGLLHLMSNHFDQAIVIVDGLDEIGTAESGSDRRDVTLVLQSLVSEKSSIKIMFLSRREADLDAILSDYDQVSIAAQRSDLTLYVGSEIEKRIKEKRLRIRNQDLKEQIRKRLVDDSDGM